LRSTGSADKAEAESICLRFEALAGKGADKGTTVATEDKGELVEAGLKLLQVAAKGELGEATAREFVNRVLKASGQAAIDGAKVGDFLDNWISGKSLSKADHTAQRYKTTIQLSLPAVGRAVSPSRRRSQIGRGRDFQSS